MWNFLLTFLMVLLPEGEFKGQLIWDEECEMEVFGTTNVSHFSCYYRHEELEEVRFDLNFQEENQGLAAHLKGAEIAVPIEAFKCRLPGMTKDFRHLLKYKEFPNLKMEMHRLLIPEQGWSSTSADMEVTYEIAGAKKAFTTPVQLEKSKDGQYYISGETAVDIRDFGLEPPVKFLGAVKVEPMVTLKFKMAVQIDRLL
ncbi:YceI family protein [Persicobacter diffluens]